MSIRHFLPLLIFIPIMIVYYYFIVPRSMDRIVGWARLRQQYKDSKPFQGKALRPFMVSIGEQGRFFTSTHSLTSHAKLGADPQFLYIGFATPLDRRFSWIMVPWEKVIVRGKCWAIPNYKFHFREVKGVSLFISLRMARKLAVLAGNIWPDLDR